MAKMETLSDPFNTTVLNTSLWSTFGAIGGTVTPTTSGLSCYAPGNNGANAGVSSLASYDLTGSYLLVHAASVGAANSGAPAQAWMTAGTVAGAPPSTALKVVVSQGTLYMGNTTTNWASPTYDPVAHAWWRIRETSGTVYFETSPDGTTWTVQGSIATASCGVTLTALYGAVYSAMFGGGSNVTAVYLSLNPTVAAVNAPAGLATASGTVPSPTVIDEASANAAMAAAAGAALQPTLALAAFAPAGLATATAAVPAPAVIDEASANAGLATAAGAAPQPSAALAAFAPAGLAAARGLAPNAFAQLPFVVPVKGYCEATVTQPNAATATVGEEGSCEATVTQPMAATATVS